MTRYQIVNPHDENIWRSMKQATYQELQIHKIQAKLTITMTFFNLQAARFLGNPYL